MCVNCCVMCEAGGGVALGCMCGDWWSACLLSVALMDVCADGV